ncbi:MAG: hypothetical protein ACLU8J_01410 [Acutalibacter sp.]
MRRLLLELKIAGINFPLVTAALSLALVLFAALAGELLDFAPIAFEVVFPLYAAIAVGEWSRFRSDAAFEAIAAQSPARFPWMLWRFFPVFATVSLFALAAMLAAAWVRPGLAWGEMLSALPSHGVFLGVRGGAGGRPFPPRAPAHPGVRSAVAGGAAHPQPAAPARGGVCLPLPALCRGPARRLAVEQGGAGGDRAAAVGCPWAARGKTAPSGPSPHNPYTQTGESVV